MMCVMAIAALSQKAPGEPAINWSTPATTALADDDIMTFPEAIVLWQYGNYLYLKYNEDLDQTAYLLVYGQTGQTYQQGDVIPAGFGGRLTEYNGEPELTNLFGFMPPISHVEVVPDDITVTDIGHDYFAHYVLLKQVTVSDLNGSTFKITDAQGNEAVGYNRFGHAVVNGYYEKLTGIVGSYGRDNIIYELLPIIWHDSFTVNCLEDLYELGADYVGRIKLKAIYQNRGYLYVQDFCGQYGLIYGDIGITVNDGDIIEGDCTVTIYADNYELIPAGDWKVISHGPRVEPEVLPIEELTLDMVHWYVKIYDFEITKRLSPMIYLIRDSTGAVIMSNKFDIDIPFNNLKDSWESKLDVNQDGEINIADVNYVMEEILTGQHATVGSRSYVIGFVGVYRGMIAIYPIEISQEDQRPSCDVNWDNEVNISDINIIIDYIIRH